MSVQLSDLLEDQKRRIYRDYLKGRQIPVLAKKYDIGEDVVWEVIGLYAQKKHPNDVGNSGLGPADLLVSNLDTGSRASEGPVVAYNTRDLRVAHEQVIEEFDHDSPAESARLADDAERQKMATEAKRLEDARTESAKQTIAENTQKTVDTKRELDEASDKGFVEMKDTAIEKIKAQPSPDDLLKARNDAAEAARMADIGAQLARDEATKASVEEATKALPDADEQKKIREDAAKAEQAVADAREAENKAAAEKLKDAVSAAPEPTVVPAAQPESEAHLDTGPGASRTVVANAQDIIDAHPKEHEVAQDVTVKLKASEDPTKMFEVDKIETVQRPDQDLTLVDTQPPVNPATTKEIMDQEAVHSSPSTPSVEAGGAVGQVTVHTQDNVEGK